MIEIKNLGYWRLWLLLLIGGEPFKTLMSEYMRRGARVKELEESIQSVQGEFEALQKKAENWTNNILELREANIALNTQVRALEKQLHGVPQQFVTRITKLRQ